LSDGRVVTAKLPGELVAHLDGVARQIKRSKNWIVRSAVQDWIDEEQKRFALNSEEAGSMDEPP
jgi:predicted transcriptional regulator